ncbi:PhzF family phenazine biosynthesis protein [Sphingomonas aliaeris]|uniref:PhzF family phenazine biosynthesis protein n=1 Tax=Sphingomonas aliaeris TaxID=2759526 RepID=A0A974NVZ0_9SPHN|nr:PhzF family phenazine biosynthesis protein [Sphingomonas aliaeris]QQV77813.1 PhzF family phenazine biosynthesis protein [Sphingomonas aliaeris]
MRIPFVQVDAFAGKPFEGNPAAVMPLGSWLDDATLQKIAEENNLSETAFLVAAADDEADFDLRWFTPGAEVALCGHATLASGHFVLSSDPMRDRVRFRTRQAGILEVSRDGDGYALALPAWGPVAKDMPGIVTSLGVTAVETLWYEKGYALVIVGSEQEVRDIRPDLRALAAEGPIVAVVSAPGVDTDIVSRVFTPAYSIDEDPVTGSAHAVMVPYWAKRLGRDDFTAYQASARGGHVACRLDGDRVVLGGSCVTVIEGTFFV